MNHNNIGTLLRQTSKPNEAIAAYRQALATLERLARENPTVTKFKISLAMSHNNIGLVLKGTGKPNEALAAHEQARTISKRLIEQNPTFTRAQLYLADSHNSIGVLLFDAEKPNEALAAYEQARMIRQRLVEENPTVTEFQIDLAGSYNNIGVLLYKTEKPNEALAAYEQARMIQHRLVEENPTIIQFQDKLALTRRSLVQLNLEAERFAEARDLLRESIEHQERALAANPSNPTFGRQLENHFRNLLKAAAGLNDLDLAAEARAGLAELAASNPRFATSNQRLTEVLSGEPAKDSAELLMLGQHANRLQRFALAARWFGEALQRDPALAANRVTQIAYNAACAAALAGTGQGNDDPPTDEADRTELRGKALAWLQAELKQWARSLETATSEQHQVVAQTLNHWQSDFDLAGIRETAELAKLPEPERLKWESLWKRVNELLEQASRESDSEDTP